MSDSSEQRSRNLDARDDRRWLIGVCISVGFGLFGVVMALLSYSSGSSPAPAPARAAGPAPGATARIPATKASGERSQEGSRRHK